MPRAGWERRKILPARRQSVRVAVGVAVMMVMVVSANGFERRGRGAAMGGLAAAYLELNGGMRDVKAVTQRTVDGVEHGGTFRQWHLWNEHVACKRV